MHLSRCWLALFSVALAGREAFGDAFESLVVRAGVVSLSRWPDEMRLSRWWHYFPVRWPDEMRLSGATA
ncbi:MAG: hypothetical protein H7839_06095 [Magnetococcus sp. YQC-5]